MITPRFTELLDWVEGRLDDDRARAVAEYVATDDEAAHTVEWLEGFLHDARLMPLHQPPPELSARLRAAFVGYHHPRQPDEWSDATLLYDTRKPAVGMRSTGTVDGIHLAFDSQVGRFVVEVKPSRPGTVDLEGMVLAGTGSAIDLAFLEAGALRRAARTDRYGRFEVRHVPDTVDELWITAESGRARAALDLRRR